MSVDGSRKKKKNAGNFSTLYTDLLEKFLRNYGVKWESLPQPQSHPVAVVHAKQHSRAAAVCVGYAWLPLRVPLKCSTVENKANLSICLLHAGKVWNILAVQIPPSTGRPRDRVIYELLHWFSVVCLFFSLSASVSFLACRRSAVYRNWSKHATRRMTSCTLRCHRQPSRIKPCRFGRGAWPMPTTCWTPRCRWILAKPCSLGASRDRWKHVSKMWGVRILAVRSRNHFRCILGCILVIKVRDKAWLFNWPLIGDQIIN